MKKRDLENGGVKVKKEKRTSLKVKMLCTIIPVIFLGFVILTVLCVSSMRSESISLVIESSQNSLEASSISMRNDIETIRMSAIDLSNIYGRYYDKLNIEDFSNAITDMLINNEMVIGCGIWFEPYAVDENQKYYGPYWYNDNGKVVETWDYSTEDYDYFSQEYYTNVANLDHIDAVFTDPYYDETSGTIMASCSSPMFYNDKFNGCITVDIDLSSVKEFIQELQIGAEGFAMLTTSSGKFIVTPVEDCEGQELYLSNSTNGNISDFSDRIIAVGLDKLRNLNYSIGMAASREKVPAIMGACKGQAINVLITDEMTAKIMLNE